MLRSLLTGHNAVEFTAECAEELKREVFTAHEIAIIEGMCDRLVANAEIIRNRVQVRQVKRG